MSVTVTAIITQDELAYLQALRQLISSSSAVIGTVEETTFAPNPPVTEAPAPAPAESSTTAPKPPAAPKPEQTPAEDSERPFKRPEKKRITKLEKQLKDVIENGAAQNVIDAAQKAVNIAERKKLVADLKRLEKLKAAQPDDVAAIDAEIGFVNAEIAELDSASAGEVESTIAKPSVPAAPGSATPPPPPAAPKEKVYETVVERKMTELAGGGTYEAFVDAGWTEQAMIDAGYLEVISTQVEVVSDVVTIEDFRTRVGAAFPKAAATNRIEAVNEIIAKFGATIDTVPEGDRAEVLTLLDSLLGE